MNIKNLAIYIIVIGGTTQGAGAQSLKLIGSIRDKGNAPIPNASVVMSGSQQGTSTNAMGNFSLAINPGSQLIITAAGYEADTVDIDHEDKLAVVLRNDGRASGVTKPGASASGPAGDKTEAMQAVSIQNSIEAFKAADQRIGGPNTSIKQVSAGKDDTKGSKFLFADWCRGIVTDATNCLIDDRYYLLNYNKISKSLVVTTDMQTGVELYKTQLRQFELWDGNGQRHFFLRVPGLNNDDFVECLTKGSKYRLYKVVNTRFIEADYRYDGIVESGHNYDEYIDDIKYYVADGNGGSVKQLEIKKKSLIAVFAKDQEKVEAYLKRNTYNDLNAAYVKEMVDYLNRP